MSVAVVIPTHGAAPYLAEAIASVRGGADEIIVVEDGTSAANESDLGGARLIRLPRVGRSAARNAGVEAAGASLIAFLDADDLALDDRIERQQAALQATPHAALCFGRVRVVDGSLEPLDEWNVLLARRFEHLVQGGATYEAILASRCPIYTSATMVRRAAFLEAGGYDTRFDAYEDLDLYLRLSQSGGLIPCPGGPVTWYRIHGQNTDSDLLYANMLAIVDKHLPLAAGGSRRLLLERRVDALWGLGRFGAARRSAARAIAREPLLLGDRRLLQRTAASFLPGPLLRARRR